jgi:hypothetical protein
MFWEPLVREADLVDFIDFTSPVAAQGQLLNAEIYINSTDM